MALAISEDFELYVRTATGPEVWTPVEDMSRFSKRNNRASTTPAVFRRGDAYVFRGKRESTYTFNGLVNTTDPGQLYLRAAEVSGDSVFIRCVPIAGSGQGFEQEVQIGTTGWDADAGSNGAQEFTMEATAVGVQEPFGDPGVML
jgi:hypothetical protein